jgi:hypothetical protein
MFVLPEMSSAVVAERRRALMAQADRRRLERAARRGRTADPAAGPAAATTPAVRPVRAVRNPSTAATLGQCGRSGAPAR